LIVRKIKTTKDLIKEGRDKRQKKGMPFEFVDPAGDNNDGNQLSDTG